MTVTVAKLRADFSEFANSAVYSDSTINFWLTLAGKLLPDCRWGTVLPEATELFVCHNLTLERQARAASAAGAPPGVQTGPVSAKTVGPASVNYDTANAMAADAGHWNLTTYGTRFAWLSSLFGAGPVQV